LRLQNSVGAVATTAAAAILADTQNPLQILAPWPILVGVALAGLAPSWSSKANASDRITGPRAASDHI